MLNRLAAVFYIFIFGLVTLEDLGCICDVLLTARRCQSSRKQGRHLRRRRRR